LTTCMGHTAYVQDSDLLVRIIRFLLQEETARPLARP